MFVLQSVLTTVKPVQWIKGESVTNAMQDTLLTLTMMHVLVCIYIMVLCIYFNLNINLYIFLVSMMLWENVSSEMVRVNFYDKLKHLMFVWHMWSLPQGMLTLLVWCCDPEASVSLWTVWARLCHATGPHMQT